MISDNVNIVDGYIVNLGIDFEIVVAKNVDRYQVLSEAVQSLVDYYTYIDEMGEDFMITDIYKELDKTEGILDVSKVHLRQQKGTGYASTRFDLHQQLSSDHRSISVPKNVVIEVKYPDQDIQGTIK
jgi:hypothetical protein